MNLENMFLSLKQLNTFRSLTIVVHDSFLTNHKKYCQQRIYDYNFHNYHKKSVAKYSKRVRFFMSVELFWMTHMSSWNWIVFSHWYLTLDNFVLSWKWVTTDRDDVVISKYIDRIANIDYFSFCLDQKQRDSLNDCQWFDCSKLKKRAILFVLRTITKT